MLQVISNGWNPTRAAPKAQKASPRPLHAECCSAKAFSDVLRCYTHASKLLRGIAQLLCISQEPTLAAPQAQRARLHKGFWGQHYPGVPCLQRFLLQYQDAASLPQKGTGYAAALVHGSESLSAGTRGAEGMIYDVSNCTPWGAALWRSSSTLLICSFTASNLSQIRKCQML